MRQGERGYSLAEMMVALGIVAILGTLGLSGLRNYFEDCKLLGAARVFHGCFLRARSIATKTSVYTAIRFEVRDDGIYYPLKSLEKTLIEIACNEAE